jgi:hypothetical protein
VNSTKPLPKQPDKATPREDDLRSHPAVRHTTLACLAALLFLLMALMDQGVGWWALLPVLIGSLALVANWSSGPPMVILSLAGILLAHSRYRFRFPSWTRNRLPTMTDLLMCGAVMTYVIGHYRLLALLQNIFPVDSRRQTSRRAPNPGERRSPSLVSSGELALLLVSVPFWLGAGAVASVALMKLKPILDLPGEMWHTLVVVWGFGLALAVGSTVANYLRQTRATPEESLLSLQDQLWRETHHEQASVNRWLVWARFRQQTRKEKL